MGHSGCGDYSWGSARHIQDLITAIMERMASLSSLKSDRGVVLRRVLLQKTTVIFGHIMLEKG